LRFLYRLKPCLLIQVVRVGRVARKIAAKAVKAVLMRADQRFNGRIISGAKEIFQLLFFLQSFFPFILINVL
jgi:hypothetical protein